MTRVRKMALLAAMALAVVASGPVSDAAARARAGSPRCMRAGRTVEFNGSIRLYLTTGRGSDYAFWACSPWSRRRLFLDESDDLTPSARIAGRYLGVTRYECYQGGERLHCRAFVVAVDMRRRRSWSTELPALADGNPAPTYGLAVTARGWVVWSSFRSGAPELEIWAMAPGGEIRQLAAGLPIYSALGAEYDTLAVAGDRVYWQLADGPRSAVLR